MLEEALAGEIADQVCNDIGLWVEGWCVVSLRDSFPIARDKLLRSE